MIGCSSRDDSCRGVVDPMRDALLSESSHSLANGFDWTESHLLHHSHSITTIPLPYMDSADDSMHYARDEYAKSEGKLISEPAAVSGLKDVRASRLQVVHVNMGHSAHSSHQDRRHGTTTSQASTSGRKRYFPTMHRPPRPTNLRLRLAKPQA